LYSKPTTLQQGAFTKLVICWVLRPDPKIQLLFDSWVTRKAQKRVVAHDVPSRDLGGETCAADRCVRFGELEDPLKLDGICCPASHVRSTSVG
jgi:hypothetical protein